MQSFCVKEDAAVSRIIYVTEVDGGYTPYVVVRAANVSNPR